MKSAVVMLTDFGVDNLSVSTMFGVCRIVDPELDVFSACHAIRPFDVLAASDALMYVMPFWPKGTVFVSVVDPGVGTARKASVARLSNGQYVVTPDNGTLTYIKEQVGIEEIREIDETINRYPTTRNIHIFHGRDLFAYCGARLASGVITYEQVGPAYPVEDVVEAYYIKPKAEDGVLSGMINEATDHFGLLGTNIPFGWLEENGIHYGDRVHVTITCKEEVKLDAELPLAKSFGYVGLGEMLMLSSETATVMLAKNQGNIVADCGLGCGPDWKLTFSRV